MVFAIVAILATAVLRCAHVIAMAHARPARIGPMPSGMWAKIV
jgi:hypothetical protein